MSNRQACETDKRENTGHSNSSDPFGQEEIKTPVNL